MQKPVLFDYIAGDVDIKNEYQSIDAEKTAKNYPQV